MNSIAGVRLFTVGVYRSKPNAYQAPGGYWFVRISPPGSSVHIDMPITPSKATELRNLGVPILTDGGGYG